MLCKECNFIGDSTDFMYEGEHQTRKGIIEVGMKCPSCGVKNIGHYLNKGLAKRRKQLERLGSGKEFDRVNRVFTSRFNKLQAESSMWT